MPFRVLSLDGGGAWALIQVRALMALYGESKTGHQILRNFDLVAAHSGGALVLAGLVEDLPLGEILQFSSSASYSSACY
jgi:patatin-like phospholipase/acyl hydrolase